jgi:LysR family hydrogen peroxide-inducible transcriptional activator
LNRNFENPAPYREISVVYHRSHLKKKIIEELKSEIVSSLPQGIGSEKPGSVIEWK